MANAASSDSLIAFDLDSTVLDNRPRQALILREFATHTTLPELTKCQAFHFQEGWSLKAAMVACGVSNENAEAVYPELKAFWAHRFFTSEYCVHDIEVVGAPRFLGALAKTRVRLAYVTGRHEAMREGTMTCLQKCGLPMPSREGKTALVMKPKLTDNDDDYKRSAHEQLRNMGQLLAAFDNEPTHVNDYARVFTGAMAIHVATDHSGREVELSDRVTSIPHFAY